MTMRVAELWSHPVKSLVGTSVDTAVFDRFGMVGDRVVAFRDLRRGRLAGSRQYPALAQWKAVGSGDHLAVELPDGSTVTHTFWLGTDSFGRDIYSRVIYGTRVSLLVGAGTATLALCLGGLLGMLAGYFRRVDALLMRVMDGLMAIPAVLLAIALVAALGAHVSTVVVAIAIPEVPRVTRLVRSLVLGLREEPFVEAARALATPTPLILWRHILPNAMAPLLVQGTFIAAAAVLTEAVLSFLGLGLPADIPTWGNIMAEGRVQFSLYPGQVLWPAMFLIPTVLAINLLGEP